jgi:mannose-6-phosphate isomerase-like protein (cupin superfamily)
VSKRAAPLPGSVGVTDLRVYDWSAPDGLVGGGPHLHLCCTEAYCVVEGAGSVQTLGPDGHVREITLEPQKIVWFTPGVIHRLINTDGRLRILVIMQNSGLPEAGDFVLTFPREILSDPKQYATHASLAPSGHVYASNEEAARARRDLAVQGFLELQRDVEQRGPKAMRDFYRLAMKLVKPKLKQWRKMWRRGAFVAAGQTAVQITALEIGSFRHLLKGGVHSMHPPGDDRKLGMCGTLGVYLPEGITR